VVLGFLKGTRVSGLPSPNDIAKALSSDGIGQHQHGDSGFHSHGEPSFTDDEVELLEGNGWHVDRHHAKVRDENGFTLSPSNVAGMLQDLRGQGAAKGDDGGAVGASVVKSSDPQPRSVVLRAPGE